MSKRIGAAVAGAAAALFLATACGTGGDAEQTAAVNPVAQQQGIVTPAPVQTGGGLDYGAAGTPAAAAPGAAVTSTAPAAAGTTVPAEALAPLSAVDDPVLGQILVDGQGRTLYRFDKDSAWPMKSNCLGSCLEKWPPATAITKADAEAVGLDPDLVSTYTRSDGTEQLSYDCWPLYWFRGDTQAGQTNGHGVQGTWWAVGPDGTKANGGKVADTSGSADSAAADY